MRIVLQVVQRASVTIDGEKISEIGKGFLLLVGFTNGDNMEIAKKMADKVCKLRIFPDGQGKTNLSLDAVNGNILSVSQFTLYASVAQGNRPCFVSSLPQSEAKELYEGFYSYLKEKIPTLQGGVFHADMKVELINDGPFTLILDSKELFGR